MAKRLHTWFVVADGASARILTRDADGGKFAVVEERDSPEARLRTRELVSDRPGRSHESGTTGRHAMEAPSDPQRLKKQEFARELARAINLACAEGRFDDLVLVAPARTLGEIKRELDGTARAKLSAALTKDLTKVPLDHLHDHLGDIRQFRAPAA
jgi:protein required for attachment to host cells